ncbi:Hypothetical predicted protein, partial [Marmota monax]
VPLQLIESVECRDIFQLHLTCKDCKVIRCQFSTFEQCQDWLNRLNNAIRPPAKKEDLFSFAYHAWCMEVYASEKEQHGDLCRPGEHVTSRFKNEVEPMGFDMNNTWRISNINEKYNWLSALESTKWLHHLSVLLKLALLVVHAVDCDQRPVLVHSSDGWDRTPQIVALAKLLLDPYYRTIEVLYPVCHVRNLMLWSAVYLPCPSPSTPVDDSCAPYPVPGTSPDDPPLSRLPKTRSFDNLTIACDSTVPLGIPEEHGGPSVLSSSLQEPYRGEDSLEVPLEQPPIEDIAENQEDAAPSIPVDVKVGYGTSLSSSLPPSQVPFETRGPNMDSSMDMLMEDNVKSESGPQVHRKPCLVITGRFSGKDVLPPALEPRPAERSLIEKPQGGSVVHRTSPGSTLSPTQAPCALPLAECKEGFVCNGAPETENKASEQPPALGTLQKNSTPNGHCANAEAGRSKDSLSRQLPSAVSSPEHPSHNHLDDDGMPVYTDTIQQRLRQIESGHQQEAETLKKQVQELKSRLESQYLTGSLCFNGDFGDEVTSIPDSESNLDQNCLSRCSTEIFSEASWEQVDKQDTEMTRWSLTTWLPTAMRVTVPSGSPAGNTTTVNY